MSNLILNDVPEEVIEALARRAAEHGRTAESEHVIILEAALGLRGASFWRAAALREETRGRILTPSEDLIRQDRDER